MAQAGGVREDGGVSGGQPEVIDNGRRYGHAQALRWLADEFDQPLRVATGYVNLGGLRELAALEGVGERRPLRLLLGAAPAPGLGEGALTDAPDASPADVGAAFDATLRRLCAERDFDAFPPSRRVETLREVDAFLARDGVEVRRYAERFLHGKAYLFAPYEGAEAGGRVAALVTSANLTGGGLHGNLELGMAHYQPGVAAEAAGWFDELWAGASDYKDELRKRLFPAVPEYTPRDIFLRMLLEYYEDDADGEPEADGLTRFQRDGYLRARRIVGERGGVLYADGVGTGKTFIGLEFIRDYARERGWHVLVIAPAQLRDTNWRPALAKENLPGQVVSFQELATDEQLAPGAERAKRVLLLDKDVYRLVIVDEAHALRNPDTTWYHALDRLLGGAEKTLVLLTATPVNNALWDLYHQIMLFARHDRAFAENGIADLRRFFADCGANDPEAIRPEAVFPLVDAVTVRRDRRFLERHYANDALDDGTPVRFPKPKLEELRYDLDGAYPGATRRITKTIDALSMARYRPDAYRRAGGGAAGRQEALAGLIKSALLKRFESSVHAALQTVTRMRGMQQEALDACEERGVMPSPATLREFSSYLAAGGPPPEVVAEALDGDEDAIPLTALDDHFLPDLRADLDHLAEMRRDLERLAGLPDPKLARLAEELRTSTARKVAIFTSYGDTARYLRDKLEGDASARGGRELVTVIGDERDSDERERQLRRFCPHTMGIVQRGAPVDAEVDLLLATDVLSEGQNLQEAQTVVSYDMPWNPQRVVQRNGRVIRLGSDHDEVRLRTLLPEQGELEAILRLEARIAVKVHAANASVGMESQVLGGVFDEERAYADLLGHARRLGGDPTLLDDGEGGQSGSFAGEEYRQLLRRAREEGEIPRLREMPWGAGAAFVRHRGTPDLALPAIVFAMRDRHGGRHWRAVTARGEVVAEPLTILRAADPADEPRAALPDDDYLDWTWGIAAGDVCRERSAALDPNSSRPSLPASQRWALDLLRDASLPARKEFARADEALLVPRGRGLLRTLSRIRREREAGERPALDAAEQVARIVLEDFGLRPVRLPPPPRGALTPDDIGVVAWQVVLEAAERAA